MYNPIRNLLILGLGSVIFSIGIWEAILVTNTGYTDDSVHKWILSRSIFDIIFGFLYISVSIEAMHFGDSKLPLLCIVNMLSFGINIWGVIEYYHENNVIRSFREVLYVEMILFYIYVSLYLLPIFICMLFLLCTKIALATRETETETETVKPPDNIVDNVV